jgi:hypothetical protein
MLHWRCRERTARCVMAEGRACTYAHAYVQHLHWLEYIVRTLMLIAHKPYRNCPPRVLITLICGLVFCCTDNNTLTGMDCTCYFAYLVAANHHSFLISVLMFTFPSCSPFKHTHHYFKHQHLSISAYIIARPVSCHAILCARLLLKSSQTHRAAIGHSPDTRA